MHGRSSAVTHTVRVESTAIPVHLGVPVLEPVRVAGREGLNSTYEYDVLMKTPDGLNLGASGAADIDLDSFIGREITILIQLDGAGEFIPGRAGTRADHIGSGTREISGIVTDAQLWGEEGRHVQYRLTIRP